MKKLGVIGGLGPMATAYFMQLVIDMTKADVDQEHIEMLIHSKPQIPDRTAYILDHTKESPLPHMIDVGNSLKAQGADMIAIPCVTAHYFQNELENAIAIPVIHTIEETAKYLKSEGVSRAGVMATDGTVTSRLFQTTLGRFGIEAIVPDAANQAKVMHIIYDNVKAGRPIDRAAVFEVRSFMERAGAEVILLGCTELSMIKRDLKISEGYLDVMEVLARASVMACGTLKQDYEHLL
ncbi:MAG: amino acid racemase [Lachnospiraceae bacterium]|nr:amino acid racemase [Lachnospiraceae bacterium]